MGALLVCPNGALNFARLDLFRFLFFLLLALGFLFHPLFISSEKLKGQEKISPLEAVVTRLKDLAIEKGTLPTALSVDGGHFRLDYTLDEQLDGFVKGLLSRYRPEMAAVVVVDNKTGRILALTDYERGPKNKNDRFGHSLVFSDKNPAASIFKVITAATLLENNDAVSPKTPFGFCGRPGTLRESQVSERCKRLTRHPQELKRAFAISNNPVFGSIAQDRVTLDQIYDMAERFGFNTDSPLKEINLPKAALYKVNSGDSFARAQLGSGYNTETTMSPLHAVLIPMVVSNDGKMPKEYPLHLVDDIVSLESKESIWKNERSNAEWVSFLQEGTVKNLKELMRATVREGTARKAFRFDKRCSISKKGKRRGTCLLEQVDIGGKTGSFTGGEPEGKRDWFVSYARPKKDESDRGISLSIMLINKDKRHVRVKSSQIARDIIHYYYNRRQS